MIMYMERMLIDNFLLLRIRGDITMHGFLLSDKGGFMQICKNLCSRHDILSQDCIGSYAIFKYTIRLFN